jgi:hypothetical protein
METRTTDSTELYELAEDFLNLNMRLMRFGMRMLPEGLRKHSAAAMSEAFEAARVTGNHFGEVISRGLHDMERSFDEPRRNGGRTTILSD